MMYTFPGHSLGTAGVIEELGVTKAIAIASTMKQTNNQDLTYVRKVTENINETVEGAYSSQKSAYARESKIRKMCSLQTDTVLISIVVDNISHNFGIYILCSFQ